MDSLWLGSQRYNAGTSSPLELWDDPAVPSLKIPAEQGYSFTSAAVSSRQDALTLSPKPQYPSADEQGCSVARAAVAHASCEEVGDCRAGRRLRRPWLSQ